MEQIRRLWPWVRPHRRHLFLALAVALAQALVDVPVPFIIRDLFDHVLDPTAAPPWWLPWDRRLAVATLFGILVGVAALRGGAARLRRVLSERVGQNIVFDLRCSLFRHLSHLSIAYFRRKSTGKIVLRFIGDINGVLKLVRDGFLRATTDLLVVSVVSVLILLLDLRLGLVTLAVLPAYAYVFMRISPRVREASHAVRSARASFSGRLQEVVAGVEVMKAFGREDEEEERLRDRTDRMRSHQLEKARNSGNMAGWAGGLVGLSGALILGYGALLVLRGEMTRGEMVAFYVLAAFLFPPMRRLVRVNETYQEARVALERIFRFFDSSEKLLEPRGGRKYVPAGGEIRFEGVRFVYQSRKAVLRGVDLHVRAGETVAVVGPNGAGKSTLVSMIPRFLTPTAGRIFLDGHDLAGLELASVRRAIAMVPQEPILFRGTIEENVRYGNPEASREEVEQAMESVRLGRILSRMPRGLRTRVGERGLTLSGGERQRIAIARAILMSPEILVLDEASSGVDPSSDEAIRRAVGRLMKGKTVIIIAHRLSTAQRADRVVVMKKGRIVEEGTHRELLQEEGFYASLCRKQHLEAVAVPAAGEEDL